MRLLLSLLLLSMLAPSVALAVPAADSPAAQAKELREAILDLPDGDPAVAYARDLRLEGSLLVGGAIGLAGGALGVALIDVLAGGAGPSVGPALVGISMGLALGMGTIGLPAMLDGQRFLVWYATHDRPPSRLARLKLLRRWRIASLSSRRTAAVVGSAFLGASTLVVASVWISREVGGVNGSGSGYDPTDALVTSGFVLGLTGAIVAAVLSDRELRQEKHRPHRLYVAPKPVALLLPMPVLSDGQVSVGLQGAMTFRF